ARIARERVLERSAAAHDAERSASLEDGELDRVALRVLPALARVLLLEKMPPDRLQVVRRIEAADDGAHAELPPLLRRIVAGALAEPDRQRRVLRKDYQTALLRLRRVLQQERRARHGEVTPGGRDG